jgi:hypothetical protein
MNNCPFFSEPQCTVISANKITVTIFAKSLPVVSLEPYVIPHANLSRQFDITVCSAYIMFQRLFFRELEQDIDPFICYFNDLPRTFSSLPLHQKGNWLRMI